MSSATTESVTRQISEVFEDAEAQAFVHARDVDTGDDIGVDADELVVTASTYKVAVALEMARRAVDGVIDLTERVRITEADRTFGTTGVSPMLDDVELSLRDLAGLMMAVSDNTATDVVMKRLGLEAINATLRSLGLVDTVLIGTVSDHMQGYVDSLGYSSHRELLDALVAGTLRPERRRRASPPEPATTSHTTPAEMTRLLQLIWTDQAGPPEACAEVRRLMALQSLSGNAARLAGAFEEGVRVAAKSGTTGGVRNEAGVVELPDGSRFAVAVYTRPESLAMRLPHVDQAIGRAAALAVEHLHSGREEAGVAL